MMPEIAPEAREWWEATRNRRLLVQSCRTCGGRQHYPRSMCLRCGGDDLGWVQATGGGVIYSFTHSHRSPDPATFEPPYTIAIVTLDEGPRILTTVTGPGVRCDSRVRLGWKPLADGRNLPFSKHTRRRTDGLQPERGTRAVSLHRSRLCKP